MPLFGLFGLAVIGSPFVRNKSTKINILSYSDFIALGGLRLLAEITCHLIEISVGIQTNALFLYMNIKFPIALRCHFPWDRSKSMWMVFSQLNLAEVGLETYSRITQKTLFSISIRKSRRTRPFSSKSLRLGKIFSWQLFPDGHLLHTFIWNQIVLMSSPGSMKVYKYH